MNFFVKDTEKIHLDNLKIRFIFRQATLYGTIETKNTSY